MSIRRSSSSARVLRGGTIIAAIGSAALSGSCRAPGGLAASARASEAHPPAQAVASPLSVGAVTPRTQSPDVAKNLSRAFAATAKAVRPSVVRIDVRSARPPLAQRGGDARGNPFAFGAPADFRRFFGFNEAPDFPAPALPGPVSGTGSGIIIDGAGNIVTNSHVVDGAGEIKVTLSDGQEIPAKLIGKDKRTDVAVIRLQRLPTNLVAARLGDSQRIDVGEWVLAIGSPLGLDQTVTAGIVSGKGHVGRLVRMSGDRVREYIQTDAKINPGNSGGPLVNLDGDVVGLNTLIRTGAGGAYGFAVPVNEVRRVAQELIEVGRVRYPFLGVSVVDLDGLDEAAKAKLGRGAPGEGAYVAVVTPGGPAAIAGVRLGDVITKLDATAVKASADVVDYVSSRAIGADIVITLFREGGMREVRVTLAPSPGEADERSDAPALGMSLQTLTPELAASLGLPFTARGAAVTDVEGGSPAARAGLRPGDVILDVDRSPVGSADEATRRLADRGADAHLLRVYGHSGVRLVSVGRNG